MRKKIPLNEPAVSIIKGMPRIKNSPYVFSSSSGSYFKGLQKSWEKIRVNLEMQDVRIHDLRHSYATILASNGASLLLIGKMLGHADPKTTQIYAHLVDKEVIKASDYVGGFLSNLGG